MAKKNKIELSKRVASQRIQTALKAEQDEQTTSVRFLFIDRFTLCDLSCKTILEYYKKAKKQESEDFKLVLDMRIIPHAFAWAGIEIERNVLNRIFGGSKSFKNRGTKSAKKLRDGIVHAMNTEDLQEMLKRQDELISLMDLYLGVMGLQFANTEQSQECVNEENQARKTA
mgnify:CR=1 FL=1